MNSYQTAFLSANSSWVKSVILHFCDFYGVLNENHTVASFIHSDSQEGATVGLRDVYNLLIFLH